VTPTDTESRVLLLMPSKDAERTVLFLVAAGIPSLACPDLHDLLVRLREGCGAILLTEEALLRDKMNWLMQALREQPAWSAIPLIVLTPGHEDSLQAANLKAISPYVTLVEKPVRVRTLTSVILAAIKTRQHQYQIRDALAERDRQAATFVSLIENAPFGVYVVDSDFRLQHVSTAAQKVFRTVRPLIGRDFAEVLRIIWTEPFASETISRFRHTLETGDPYAAPAATERRADIGQVESYDWKIERIALPNGRHGAVCYFYDVTERKQAEEERERLARQRQLALDAARLGWWHIDPATSRVTYDKRYADIYGLSGHERLVSEISPLIHPDDSESVWAAVKAAINTVDPKSYFVEYRVNRPDGETRWVQAHGLATFEGEGAARTPASFVGTVSDVTDRRRAEDELRDKTERLNLLLENVYDYAVIISDTEDRIIEWQGGAERITGYAPAEAIGLTTDFIFTPEDQASRRPQLELQTAAKTGRAENTRWHVRKDGVRFFAHGVTVALRDEAQRLRGFGKVFRDATAEKEAAEALRDADRRKDQFLATLAHELRNPLAPISNALQVWPLIEGDSQAATEIREMMERQVKQMIRLIDDLLDVSRITRGKIELRKESLDLATVVQGAIEGVRPFVDACGHLLTVELPPEPARLIGDSGRLVQVLGNLVHNAAKYTGRDGQIRVSAGIEEGIAVITVQDTGPGIPSEMLASVFEMFSQVDQTLDRSHGGLGIGLTLVRTLVELHGGSVTAANRTDGAGCEFTVRLPALTPDGASSGPETCQRTHVNAPPLRRRVLIVDDVRPSANTLSIMLKGLGQEVSTAYDGYSALATAREFRPEVAFLDIAMPKMDGYELARRILAIPGARPVLVALTGYGQEEDRQRAFQAGFDHHMVKPASLESLHAFLLGIDGQR